MRISKAKRDAKLPTVFSACSAIVRESTKICFRYSRRKLQIEIVSQPGLRDVEREWLSMRFGRRVKIRRLAKYP